MIGRLEFCWTGEHFVLDQKDLSGTHPQYDFFGIILHFVLESFFFTFT
jgi:hypothetical protein